MSASKVRSNTQKGGDQDLSLDGFSTLAIMKNCSVVLDANVVPQYFACLSSSLVTCPPVMVNSTIPNTDLHHRHLNFGQKDSLHYKQNQLRNALHRQDKNITMLSSKPVPEEINLISENVESVADVEKGITNSINNYRISVPKCQVHTRTVFVCPKCKKYYTSKLAVSSHHFKAHKRAVHFNNISSETKQVYVCELCSISFFKIDNLQSHVQNFHSVSPHRKQNTSCNDIKAGSVVVDSMPTDAQGNNYDIVMDECGTDTDTMPTLEPQNNLDWKLRKYLDDDYSSDTGDMPVLEPQDLWIANDIQLGKSNKVTDSNSNAADKKPNMKPQNSSVATTTTNDIGHQDHFKDKLSEVTSPNLAVKVKSMHMGFIHKKFSHKLLWKTPHVPLEAGPAYPDSGPVQQSKSSDDASHSNNLATDGTSGLEPQNSLVRTCHLQQNKSAGDVMDSDNIVADGTSGLEPQNSPIPTCHLQQNKSAGDIMDSNNVVADGMSGLEPQNSPVSTCHLQQNKTFSKDDTNINSIAASGTFSLELQNSLVLSSNNQQINSSCDVMDSNNIASSGTFSLEHQNSVVLSSCSKQISSFDDIMDSDNVTAGSISGSEAPTPLVPICHPQKSTTCDDTMILNNIVTIPTLESQTFSIPTSHIQHRVTSDSAMNLNTCADRIYHLNSLTPTVAISKNKPNEMSNDVMDICVENVPSLQKQNSQVLEHSRLDNSHDEKDDNDGILDSHDIAINEVPHIELKNSSSVIMHNSQQSNSPDTTIECHTQTHHVPDLASKKSAALTNSNLPKESANIDITDVCNIVAETVPNLEIQNSYVLTCDTEFTTVVINDNNVTAESLLSLVTSPVRCVNDISENNLKLYETVLRYRCQKCSKHFHYKKHLVVHWLKCHNFKSNCVEPQHYYQCSWCRKGYFQLQSLKLHLKSLHNIQTDKCSTGDDNLILNKNDLHDVPNNIPHSNNEKQTEYKQYELVFLCPTCNQSFTSAFAVCIHFTDVHKSKINCMEVRSELRVVRNNSEPQDCSCNLCNKSFSSKVHLMRHIVLCQKRNKPSHNQPVKNKKKRTSTIQPFESVFVESYEKPKAVDALPCQIEIENHTQEQFLIEREKDCNDVPYSIPVISDIKEEIKNEFEEKICYDHSNKNISETEHSFFPDDDSDKMDHSTLEVELDSKIDIVDNFNEMSCIIEGIEKSALQTNYISPVVQNDSSENLLNLENNYIILKTTEYPCIKCNLSFTSRLKFQSHNCKNVDGTAMISQNKSCLPLLKHSKPLQSNPLTEIITNFPCIYCDMLCTDIYTAASHCSIKHEHACCICTQVFRTKQEIEEHSLLHVLNKIIFYKCMFCTTEFKVKAECEWHLEVDHKVSRPELCQPVTKNQSICKKLLGKIFCPFCKLNFVKPVTLNYHIRMKHNIKPCLKCNINFIDGHKSQVYCKNCKCNNAIENEASSHDINIPKQSPADNSNETFFAQTNSKKNVSIGGFGLEEVQNILDSKKPKSKSKQDYVVHNKVTEQQLCLYCLKIFSTPKQLVTHDCCDAPGKLKEVDVPSTYLKLKFLLVSNVIPSLVKKNAISTIVKPLKLGSLQYSMCPLCQLLCRTEDLIKHFKCSHQFKKCTKCEYHDASIELQKQLCTICAFHTNSIDIATPIFINVVSIVSEKKDTPESAKQFGLPLLLTPHLSANSTISTNTFNLNVETDKCKKCENHAVLSKEICEKCSNTELPRNGNSAQTNPHQSHDVSAIPVNSKQIPIKFLNKVNVRGQIHYVTFSDGFSSGLQMSLVEASVARVRATEHKYNLRTARRRPSRYT